MLPPLWYSLSKLLIFSMAAIFFLLLWRRGEPSLKDKYKGKTIRDLGVLWLGLAYALWAIIAVFEVMLHKTFSPHLVYLNGIVGLSRSVYLSDFFRPIVSTCNSILFLFAIQDFAYSPGFLKGLSRNGRWYMIASAFGLLIIVGNVIVANSAEQVPEMVQKVVWGFLPDFILSFVTVGLIGIVFFRSFTLRGFNIIAYMVLVPAVILLLLQIREVLPGFALSLLDETGRRVLLLSSTTGLAMAFIMLVVSSLYETLRLPAAEKMLLSFTGQQNGNNWLVEVSYDLEHKSDVYLSNVLHRKLLVFAVLRKYYSADEAWWRVNDDDFRLGERFSFDNIARICRHHFGVERPTLFDNNRGLYRLKFPPKNIFIDFERLSADKDLHKILKHYE